MSEKQNVIRPVGSVAPQPPRSRSTSSAGVGGPAGRVGVEASADGVLELLGLSRVDAVPFRGASRRWRARQQRQRGRGEPVHVARGRGHAIGGELRCHEVRGVGPAGHTIARRRHPEVDELDLAPLGQDQVRGLHVAVDQRRVVAVQVHQRLGRLGQVGEDAPRCEPGSTAIAQQRGQVDAIDPVHRDDVVVAVEEVVAHEGQRRVRCDREQHARLGEQGLSRTSVMDRSDLQGDEPAVLAVQRLDHPRRTADTEGLEELVAILEELCHHLCCLAKPTPRRESLRLAVSSWSHRAP